MKKWVKCLVACTVVTAMLLSGVGALASGGEEIVLEFAQWWEPELPDGAFRALMDEFEAQNPGVKVELLSGPFATTKEQVIAGAAAGTMADVVGLDGSWVNDFVKQGSIANLSELMSQASYDAGQLSAEVKLNGATYMIPVLNFTYPLFLNKEIMAAAGVTEAPKTRSEFLEVAKAMNNPANNVSGWALPLSMDLPNGIQNDVMSWLWVSGKHMLKDGRPDLLNEDVKEMVAFIKEVYDAGVVAPGAFTMKAPDRVEEFTNGRVGMMISSLSHINVVRRNNPDLDFMIAPVPVADGYTGETGITFASWGIGVSSKTEHPEMAWKLVAFILEQENNAKLATMANAFPGNKNAVPDFARMDELFQTAFEIYQNGYLINEFTGLPVSEDLMRSFDEQLQLMLEDRQGIDEMLQAAQAAWEERMK